MAFSPTDIAGLRWYDPTAGVFQDSAQTTPAGDGQVVGGWVDQSGNDDASASSTARPTYDADGFGAGLPGILFAGSHILSLDSFAAQLTGEDQPYTLVVALKKTNNTGAQVFFGAGSSSSPNPQIYNYTANLAANYTCVRRADTGGGTVVTASGGTPNTSAHVLTLVFTGAAVTLRVDGVAVIDNAALNNATMTLDRVAFGALPTNTSPAFYLQALLGDACLIPRVLTSDEIDQLESFVAPRCGLNYPFDLVELTAPAPYQVFQRSGSTGDIAIVGNIRLAGTHDVEARFAGGDWTTIASGESGAFTATLSGQAQGQGALEVRLVSEPTRITTRAHVGIGDIFVVAGQSNASGRGTNNQTYSHATLKAALYGNDYTWKELSDPTDSPTNQADTVSSDSSPAAAGSPWPLLATLIMADQGVPVAFVPAAKGGSVITSWLPDTDRSLRSTLYGSMNYRAGLTGAKCVLWWQGENDALAQMDQTTYNGHLDTVADAVNTDLGVKLMPCKLQHMTTVPDADQTPVNAAIAEAWADNANVLEGPDFSDITPSVDGLHMKTDAELQTTAERWWAALEAALYGA